MRPLTDCVSNIACAKFDGRKMDTACKTEYLPSVQLYKASVDKKAIEL
ncbi:MAG: hypothetical protein ACI9R7_001159 [Lysobacterales bacterium]|jgi:hypothetical protein